MITFSSEASVHCDDCDERVSTSGNITDVRRLARDLGWKRYKDPTTGAKCDRCPACVKKAKDTP